MAHNLDQSADRGQTAFVAARQDAWHQLGTITEDAFTAEQAMTLGHLGGWNVRKVPTFAAIHDTGDLVAMPGRYATVRDNPFGDGIDVLGNVGEQYHIIQNEEHAALLDALVDESGAHFETAGAIAGGRRVFITMKLPGHIRIGGVDQVDNYIAAMNSHDGSTPFTLLVTPIRIVCQNTLNLAFQNHQGMFRVRHTRNAQGAIQQAREALDMTFDYLDDFQAEANRLLDTEMTNATFADLIKNAYGVSDEAPASAQTRSERRLDEMMRLFTTADTQAAVRGTAWAGLNALTEWADHFSPVSGYEDEQERRSVKAVLDPAFKNRARELVLAAVR